MKAPIVVLPPLFSEAPASQGSLGEGGVGLLTTIGALKIRIGFLEGVPFKGSTKG